VINTEKNHKDSNNSIITKGLFNEYDVFAFFGCIIPGLFFFVPLNKIFGIYASLGVMFVPLVIFVLVEGFRLLLAILNNLSQKKVEPIKQISDEQSTESTPESDQL
jgi:hypothetical protein